jgi:hypothetical protein
MSRGPAGGPESSCLARTAAELARVDLLRSIDDGALLTPNQSLSRWPGSGPRSDSEPGAVAGVSRPTVRSETPAAHLFALTRSPGRHRHDSDSDAKSLRQDSPGPDRARTNVRLVLGPHALRPA